MRFCNIIICAFLVYISPAYDMILVGISLLIFLDDYRRPVLSYSLHMIIDM